MKLKDIEKCAEFLSLKCPLQIGLSIAKKCDEYDVCLDCWLDSLELEENRDKLEDEIDIEV